MTDTRAMAVFLRAMHLRAENRLKREMLDAQRSTSDAVLAVTLGCLALDHQVVARTLEEMIAEHEGQRRELREGMYVVVRIGDSWTHCQVHSVTTDKLVVSIGPDLTFSFWRADEGEEWRHADEHDG